MASSKVQLLDAVQITQKLQRIAFQIMEENFDEKEITLVGIKEGGYVMAKKLQQVLKKNSTFMCNLASIQIDKKNPLQSELSVSEKDFSKKVIVIVDDVANTGRTLFYAMSPFRDSLPSKIQLAVLVDRQHKTFPVSPDYVGMSLATTMKEHIHVEFSKNSRVYLT